MKEENKSGVKLGQCVILILYLEFLHRPRIFRWSFQQNVS